MVQTLFEPSAIECSVCHKKMLHVEEAHPLASASAQCLGCGRIGHVTKGVFVVNDHPASAR